MNQMYSQNVLMQAVGTQMQGQVQQNAQNMGYQYFDPSVPRQQWPNDWNDVS